jgi:hypothetical protein
VSSADEYSSLFSEKADIESLMELKMRSISDGFTLCCSFDISLMARLDASFPPLYPPTPSATEKIYPPSASWEAGCYPG